jgi:hypothetical protein
MGEMARLRGRPKLDHVLIGVPVCQALPRGVIFPEQVQ